MKKAGDLANPAFSFCDVFCASNVTRHVNGIFAVSDVLVRVIKRNGPHVYVLLVYYLSSPHVARNCKKSGK